MLIRWFGFGQPLALAKVLSVMPSALARSFIWRAKASSVPASPSATTTQASLPERTTMPLINSSTVGRSVSLRNMVEPCIDLAWDETGKRSSRFTRPSRSASNSMLIVISFDIEAGGSFSCAFFSRSTVPVETS